MMASSNGNIFRVTGHLCGEFTGPRWIPAQRPVMWSFDVFFDLRPNKRLSKQSWGWWSETPSSSLWRHRNEKDRYNNPSRPRQNSHPFCRRHFQISFLVWKCLYFDSNLIEIVCNARVQLTTQPELIQKMAWRRSGDKPLSEPRMA